MGSCLRKAPQKPVQNDEYPPERNTGSNPNIVSALHMQPVRINSLKSTGRLKSKSWLADDLSSDGGGSDSSNPSKSSPVDVSATCNPVKSPTGRSSSTTPNKHTYQTTSPTHTNESEFDDAVFISPLGDSYREINDDVVAEGIDPQQRDTVVLVSKAANSSFRQKRISYSQTASTHHNLLLAEDSVPEEAEEEKESRASFFDAPAFDGEEHDHNEQQQSPATETFTPTRYGNLPEYLPYIMQEDNQANISRQSQNSKHLPPVIQQQSGGDSDDEVEVDNDDEDEDSSFNNMTSLTPFGSRSPHNSSFIQQTSPPTAATAAAAAVVVVAQAVSPVKPVTVKRQSSQLLQAEPEYDDSSSEYATATTPKKVLTRRRSQSHSSLMEILANTNSSTNSPIKPVDIAAGSVNNNINNNNNNNNNNNSNSSDNNDLMILPPPETRTRADSAPESLDDEAAIFAGAAGKNVDRSFLTDLAKERNMSSLSLKKSSENSEHDEEKLRHYARLGRAAVVTPSGQRSSLLAGRGGRGAGSRKSQEFLKRASTITPATKIGLSESLF